jgi:pSer/pThr/pTyr-binding forkhead associated (FHA) protein
MSMNEASRSFLSVERGKQQGQIYELHRAVVTIGRVPSNDVVLPDPTMGRLHARIHPLGEGAYGIEDTGSPNGVVLNGHRLKRGDIQVLQDGDRIYLGEAVLVFRTLREAQASS